MDPVEYEKNRLAQEILKRIRDREREEREEREREREEAKRIKKQEDEIRQFALLIKKKD